MGDEGWWWWEGGRNISEELTLACDIFGQWDGTQGAQVLTLFTCFCGGTCQVRLMIGHNDLEELFQLK